MVTDDRLRRLLEFDPIGEAEKTIGDESPGLSLLYVHANGDAKREALSARNDTYWACPRDYLQEILDLEGFVFLHKNTEAPSEDSDHYVKEWYWHPQDAILLYTTSSLRSPWRFTEALAGKPERPKEILMDALELSFNCAIPPSAYEHLRGVPGSESWVNLPKGDGFRCRYTCDGREGLRFKLRKLRTYGAFVNPWRYRATFRPFGYHFDNEDNDAWLKRFSQMPEEVQKALAIVLE